MGGLLLGIFAALVVATVPIGFALATAASIAVVVANLPVIIIPQQIVAGMDSFPMLAVPLFILAGFLMDVGGISQRLVTLARALVGHLPGGLGQVVIIAEIFFSGVSGSTSADAAAIGGIMVPQLMANGYSRARSTAIGSAACGLGILIPPAIVMVVYGVIGNVSVGALFVASITPALLMAVGLMTQIGWQARREKWPTGERATFAEVRHAAVAALLPLSLIVVILGGIRFGLFTPTEAAALGALFCFLLVACYGKLTWQVITKSVAAATTISVMVFVILTGSAAFSQILAFTGITVGITELAFSWSEHPILILIAMQVMLLLLGMLIEQTSIVMITTPIYFPIVSAFGWDPVWFGAIMLLNLEMATISPPFGLSLFVMKGITSKTTTMGDIYRAALPFVALNLVVMGIMIAVPGTVLWLPALMR